MTDDERKEYEERTAAAERAAYEARRDAVAAVRDALDLPALEERLEAMSPDILTPDTRAWVDAIRAGASALRLPPEPVAKD